jgi:hypothetical protein
MADVLTNQQILEQLRHAFAPFSCVAELQDYERQIGFRVYGDGEAILGTFEGHLLASLRDPAAFRELIAETRSFLESRERVTFSPDG